MPGSGAAATRPVPCAQQLRAASHPSLSSSGDRGRRVGEYQYYEFQAHDQRLSTRNRNNCGRSPPGRASPQRASQHLRLGRHLSGNPRRMAERHFDGHLYVTDRGTHRLTLRLPKQTLNLPMVQPYGLGHHSRLDHPHPPPARPHQRGRGRRPGRRSRRLSGRLHRHAERNHHRRPASPLYLAWLAAWELGDDDEAEYQACPARVAADLGELTAPQRARGIPARGRRFTWGRYLDQPATPGKLTWATSRPSLARAAPAGSAPSPSPWRK